MDLRTDPFIRDFFELDLHNPESLCFSPIKIAEMDEFPLGVRDFVYLNDRGWIFVALSDMKLASRLDAYLTNAKMPWEKKEKEEEQTYATVGGLLLYNVNVEPDGKQWMFSRMWAANFPSQTNILHWTPEQKLLFIGLDSGAIHVYKVTDTAKGLEEISNFKAHSKRVMGLSYDIESSMLFSIGEDSMFKVTDINQQEPIYEEKFNHQLKSLEHEKNSKRVFIGDDKGWLYIYSHKCHPPE